ncbi:TetR/AcrR family transcriptional regulator [Streptomyces litchfieldiae]|uniref:TetR/AcrR family transcriptional regulator n=1 Tax=Streptomyces litchfieldiae TaxID=3075543 RepID=A0ABU2MZ26_9ACTN|nr:TetR/AcrR family transcriptional regulator [Streptomyces sp. DSM 44938]MDT0346912.1 TetR/AcrR family transcriptional regulator [Streptomyces sp. DSM 44938]
MARTADHDLRRRQIAAAVHRLVATEGLDAATVAGVAREAGYSVGLVQHYFRSKDELLLFAYNQVTKAIHDRVAARIADGVVRKRTISAVVFDSLLELLPIDDERRGEFRVSRAFLGRSLENDTLAEVARTAAADIRGQLAVAVHNGKECGEVEPHLDPDLAATRVTALVDGLAEQLYQDPARAVGRRTLRAAAEEIIRACLDSVFTGECRQYRS